MTEQIHPPPKPSGTHPRGSALFVGNFLSSSHGVKTFSEDLSERLASAGWTILRASSRRTRLARLVDMVHTAWAKRREYAVAHVDLYSGPAFSWAETVCWVLRRAGKPYILTLHGGRLPEFARRHPRRTGRLLRSAAAVTAPSGYLISELKVPEVEPILLPNTLELARYAFRGRQEVRPRFVWLRAFHRLYNPTLAIRALALLRERHPDSHLEMVGPDKGDGTFREARRLARSLDLEEHIHFRGAIPKAAVPALLDEGDIFLNTSSADNTPVSVLEAMACGLCIVSTDAGGLTYLLSHGEDSLIVPMDDARQMAAAAHRLITDSALAERLSRNARKKVERFDWAHLRQQWTSLLTSVAASSGREPPHPGSSQAGRD